MAAVGALLVLLPALAALLGWMAGVRSGSTAADSGPALAPSMLTVEVEETQLRSTIAGRADVVLEDSTTIAVDADLGDEGMLVDRPILTKSPPPLRAAIAEGGVLAEVLGRPIFAFEGALPMYRRLRAGLAGPDVSQLQAGLDRLGFDVGSIDGKYGPATAKAVRDFYEAAGYAPAQPSETDRTGLEGAEKRVDQLSRAVADAEQLLRQASQGAASSVILGARSAVAEAERALEAAELARDSALDNDDLTEDEWRRLSAEHNAAVAAAEDALEIAKAYLAETTAPPRTETESAQLQRAEADLGLALRDLEAARSAATVTVPRGEIVFLPSLPRTIAAHPVALGDVVTDELVSLASPDLSLAARFSRADLTQIEVGDAATIELGEGRTANSRVVELRQSDDDETLVMIQTDSESLAEHLGANFRVEIVLQSTDAEVLVVPTAAVATSADGASRVTVVVDNEIDREVEVEVGLSTGGMVQVIPSGPLAKGEKVLIGYRG